MKNECDGVCLWIVMLRAAAGHQLCVSFDSNFVVLSVEMPEQATRSRWNYQKWPQPSEATINRHAISFNWLKSGIRICLITHSTAVSASIRLFQSHVRCVTSHGRLISKWNQDERPTRAGTCNTASCLKTWTLIVIQLWVAQHRSVETRSRYQAMHGTVTKMSFVGSRYLATIPRNNRPRQKYSILFSS